MGELSGIRLTKSSGIPIIYAIIRLPEKGMKKPPPWHQTAASRTGFFLHFPLAKYPGKQNRIAD